MSGRGGVRLEPMKVVFINTQYVETDARSFKTVVQELTGKDAIVAAGPFESASHGSCYGGGGGEGGVGQVGTVTEYDRFFKEMLHMEELYNLWSEYGVRNVVD